MSAQRPVAVLVLRALADCFRREGEPGRSMLEIPAHPRGKQLRPWTRSEVFDEMLAPG